MENDQIRFCGVCEHYSPKEAFDMEGEENTQDIGLCRELDHIVWFFTPAENCDYREPERPFLRGKCGDLSVADWDGC